jgi:hypothetical protein
LISMCVLGVYGQNPAMQMQTVVRPVRQQTNMQVVPQIAVPLVPAQQNFISKAQMQTQLTPIVQVQQHQKTIPSQQGQFFRQQQMSPMLQTQRMVHQPQVAVPKLATLPPQQPAKPFAGRMAQPIQKIVQEPTIKTPLQTSSGVKSAVNTTVPILSTSTPIAKSNTTVVTTVATNVEITSREIVNLHKMIADEITRQLRNRGIVV